MRQLIALLGLLVGLHASGQTKINLVVLKKGQKIFLERGDYMNDKIYAVTDMTDTVQVILADQTFYKFRNGDFEAWAITNQLNENTDIITNQSISTFPFSVMTDKETIVYREGKMGADKLTSLKKGVEVTAHSIMGLFYEITFGKNQTGYIVTTAVPGPERDRNKAHIMRAIFDDIRNRNTGSYDEEQIRSKGKFISKFKSEGYSSETFRVGNTLYTITKYCGRTEISSYVSN